MTRWHLVSDVGGTNVRFARALAGGRLEDRAAYRVAGFPDFADALRAYLRETGAPPGCAGARIAAAGPVTANEIRLTNLAWTIRGAGVSEVLGGAPVALFNDLQAAALSIPYLDAEDLLEVVAGAGGHDRSEPRLAVNLGTGFGAAMLVPERAGWRSLASEAGHMTLAAATEAELALLGSGSPRFRSVEHALSGPGLANLYAYFAARDGAPGTLAAGPGEIFAKSGTDPAAGRAAETFAALLARICGDLVVAAAAWGGLYLFGSVALGWHAQGPRAMFRQVFTDKEKMAPQMASVPVHVVRNDSAPLIGLARQ